MTYVVFQVLPGLYVGNYRDSKDASQLERFEITHIVAIHDAARKLHSVSNLSRLEPIRLNIQKFYILPTQYICGFCLDPRTNIHLITFIIRLMHSII